MALPDKIDDSEIPAQNVLRGSNLTGTIQVKIVKTGSHQFYEDDGSLGNEARTITVPVNGVDMEVAVGGDNLPGLKAAFGDRFSAWVGQQVVIAPKQKLNPRTKQNVMGLSIIPAPKMG